VRNGSSVFALLVALLALGSLGAAAYAAYRLPEITWLEGALALPVVALLAFLSLSLAGRGRAAYQRSLGRKGGERLARLARALGLLAFLLVLTAALAVGVYGVLTATEGLSRTPW
jgi:TRAP-type C4-dicarboxylate transport system permease small subunit